jgi:hypothetical protein
MEGVTQKAAPIASLCRCGCGVTLFPMAELGYASAECLWRLHGATPPPVTKSPARSHLIKVGARRIVEPEEEESSPFITPGQVPEPPPPIVFPSEYAKRRTMRSGSASTTSSWSTQPSRRSWRFSGG